MSLVINGTQANSTTPLTATVSSIASGAGGVMRVATSSPHLFGDGDAVKLNVTISAVALVIYGFITVIDATHFDVTGTTYTATGTGAVTDLSLSPQIQFPTDGDSFSLQLSGMLSGLQGLADRTQALRYMILSRTSALVNVMSTQNVPIPPWATHVLVDGCGGGGGGGGGPGGYGAAASSQIAAGSGGSGAQRSQGIYPVSGFGVNPTSIDVTIGVGGTGGAGSGGGSPTPSSASDGTDGSSSGIKYHDGTPGGTYMAILYGGSHGGGGAATPICNVANGGTPVFTPGGRGPEGQFRSGPVSQTSPGYRQLNNIVNSSGTISSPAGWSVPTYTDPTGQMDYCEGGASVASGHFTTYLAAISYAGAPSQMGQAGGAAGAVGAEDLTYVGGAGGGGGGGGGFGPGGAAGAGGAAAHAGTGATGVVGTAAAANSGGGGGGGGGGGNGSAAGGPGLAGGNGGSGQVNLLFIACPAVP